MAQRASSAVCAPHAETIAVPRWGVQAQEARSGGNRVAVDSSAGAAAPLPLIFCQRSCVRHCAMSLCALCCHLRRRRALLHSLSRPRYYVQPQRARVHLYCGLRRWISSSASVVSGTQRSLFPPRLAHLVHSASGCMLHCSNDPLNDGCGSIQAISGYRAMKMPMSF